MCNASLPALLSSVHLLIALCPAVSSFLHMQEMARTTRSNFKRETTHFGGMVSPSTSMSTTNGTFLKDEDGKDAFSDKSQAPSFSNAGQSQNDLDEGYARQVAERKIRRSASRKFLGLSFVHFD